jgi:DNA-binding phage protein
MHALEPKEIVDLLRAEVKRAGSQEAWAKMAGVQRTEVSKTITGKRSPSKTIIRALGLRVVVVKD